MLMIIGLQLVITHIQLSWAVKLSPETTVSSHQEQDDMKAPAQTPSNANHNRQHQQQRLHETTLIKEPHEDSSQSGQLASLQQSNSMMELQLQSKVPPNHRSSSSRFLPKLTASDSLVAKSINETPPMQLIAVDQPLSWSSSQQQSQSIIFEDDPSLRAADPSASSSFASTDSSLMTSTSESRQTPNNKHQNLVLFQDSLQAATPDFREPGKAANEQTSSQQKTADEMRHISDDDTPNLEGGTQAENVNHLDEQQATKSSSSQLSSPVQRRLGLLKKAADNMRMMANPNQQQHAYFGHHPHSLPFGAPQSYSAPLSDCDRCVVSSISGGPNYLSTSGRLLQAAPEPPGLLDTSLPPPPTPPSPVLPSVLPSPNAGGASSGGVGHIPTFSGNNPPLVPGPGPGQWNLPFASSGHHMGPIKSKLLLKFPFLLKTHHKTHQLMQNHFPQSTENGLIGQQASNYQQPTFEFGTMGIPLPMGLPLPIQMPLPMPSISIPVGLSPMAMNDGNVDFANAPDYQAGARPNVAAWHYASHARPQPMTGAIYLRQPATGGAHSSQYHCVQAAGFPSLSHQAGPSSSLLTANQPPLYGSSNQQQVEAASNVITTASKTTSFHNNNQARHSSQALFSAEQPGSSAPY